MELKELKDKYYKAHGAYLAYRNINKTNETESQFIPDALQAIKKAFPESNVTVIGDNLLNYLGVDFVVSVGEKQMLLDLKVCQHNNGFNVCIDGYKHKGNDWFPANDVKINDWFLFINGDYFIFIPSNLVDIPPMEDCFFYKRDIYKTTKKAIVDLSCKRKIAIPRGGINGKI